MRFSLRNFEESIAVTKILKAPNGVTKAAGANAYAKRLAASPIPTVDKKNLVKLVLIKIYEIVCILKKLLVINPNHHSQCFK